MPIDPTTVARAAAIATAVLLFGLVLFQIALAAGAPFGRAAYGGRSARPSGRLRVSSAVAAVFWSAAALVVLRRGDVTGWAPLPDAWLGVAVWVLVGLAVVAVVMNAITPSALERAIWLPFSVLLLAGMLTVAMGTGAIGTVATATGAIGTVATETVAIGTGAIATGATATGAAVGGSASS